MICRKAARIAVFIVAAVASGLFASRIAAELFYPLVPSVLDYRFAAGVAIAFAFFALIPALVSRDPCIRAILPPQIALLLVWIRPFPDAIWSIIVLASVLVAVLLPVAGRRFAAAKPWGGVPLAAGLIGIVPFLVYVRTMAPSVVAGDGAEFQSAAYTLGIAHPTGYPLYLLIGKAFTFLPFGNAAYRVNLVSGVFAALAVGVLVAGAWRIGGDWRAAAIGGLTFAFSAVYWSQAVEAEVYALNAFLVLLILYLMLKGLQSPVKAAAASRDLGPYSLWLILGLGLAHHRTALLLLPALIAYVLIARRWGLTNPRAVFGALGLLLLPLSTYLYLPVRWEAVTGQALDWAQFRWHVLASGYSFVLRPESLWQEPGRYVYVLGWVNAQLTSIGIVFAVLGLILLAKRSFRAAALTLLVFIVFAVFPVSYHVPDTELFAIPAIAVAALWIGVAVADLTQMLGVTLRRKIGVAGGGTLFCALALLLPGFLLVNNYASVDASRDLSLDRWGRLAMAQQVQPGAVVVADMLRMSALRYFYQVEAAEKNVFPLMPDTEDVATNIIEGSVGSSRPVYLARYLPGLEKRYALSAAGPLVEVRQFSPEGTATASQPTNRISEAVVAPGIRLLGWDGGVTEVAAGETWRGSLYWQADQKQSESYYVHLRLIDPDGRAVSPQKPGVPVQGMYPTWAWPQNYPVADYRELEVPVDTRPGDYRLEVGLGGAFRLPVQWTTLSELRVQPPANRVTMKSTLAVFGRHLALTGYEWSGVTRPGGALKVTLRWQSIDPEVDALLVQLALIDLSGRLVWSSERLEQQRPLGRGESWDAFYEIQLPADVAAGTYRLAVRLDNMDGKAVGALSGFAALVAEQAILAEIQVTERPGGPLTNMENKAILVRHSLESDELRAGDTLRLTLYWQAASKVSQDYTVFVHLLDARERVRAQADTFPAGGLRPTSAWHLNEIVEDAYAIPLPNELPPGRYQIEVGMYLAANMQRLQLIDDQERPIDDRVVVGEISVVK